METKQADAEQANHGHSCKPSISPAAQVDMNYVSKESVFSPLEHRKAGVRPVF